MLRTTKAFTLAILVPDGCNQLVCLVECGRNLCSHQEPYRSGLDKVMMDAVTPVQDGRRST
jgi:hypothetical protein